MKKAPLLVIGILLLTVSLVANTPTMPSIEIVLDTTRPADVDILLLRNGDKLTGTVMNEKFSIRTSYAHIEIATNYIAGINLEGGTNNIESVISVNNNRFSGFIDNPFVVFKLDNGPQLEIRREKIQKVVFRVRQNETAGMKWRQFMQLKNGDYFHGMIMNKDILISTTYAKIPLNFSNIESIAFIEDDNILTIVKMNNGDTVQGILETEDIVIELDVATSIKVYQDRIEKIQFNKDDILENHTSIGKKIQNANFGDMIFVEKGTFIMGDTWGGGNDDEKPTHKVTLSYNFYIGKHEVTFEEYDEFCEETHRSKPDDVNWGRGKYPVINVSWNDAIAYCNWLSEKNKLPVAYDNSGNFLDKNGNITIDPLKVVGYRLPTEAEWEYAARGGNKSEGYKYSGSDSPDQVAWYDSNFGDMTNEVMTKQPNELGIYDMSGNVCEWCSDWYGSYSSLSQTNSYHASRETYRVKRGGSWLFGATYVRVASRSGYRPHFADFCLGFRLCRTVN